MAYEDNEALMFWRKQEHCSINGWKLTVIEKDDGSVSWQARKTGRKTVRGIAQAIWVAKQEAADAAEQEDRRFRRIVGSDFA